MRTGRTQLRRLFYPCFGRPAAAAAVTIHVGSVHLAANRGVQKHRTEPCLLVLDSHVMGDPQLAGIVAVPPPRPRLRRAPLRRRRPSPAVSGHGHAMLVSSCCSPALPPSLPLPRPAPHRTPPPAAAPATTAVGSGDQMVTAAAPGIHSTSSTS